MRRFTATAGPAGRHKRRSAAATLAVLAVLIGGCNATSTPVGEALPTQAATMLAPESQVLPPDEIGYAGTGTSSAERTPLPAGPQAIAAYPAYDAIRPIYSPTFVEPSGSLLQPKDLVIGLALNGEARAYPVRILRFREMVNDVVGGTPILATW